MARSRLGVDAIYGLSLLLVLSFAPRGFSPGAPVFSSSQKPTLSNFNSICNARTRFNDLLGTPKCSVVKQITLHYNPTYDLSSNVLGVQAKN